MEGATADGDADEPLPPWLSSAAASSPASVPTLQDMVCTVLARHLHCFESLDDLPEHLAASVKAAVQRDRRLLSDDGITVWAEAVFAAAASSSDAGKLSLRWASSLSDAGLKNLAEHNPHWAAALVELDMGFCEGVGDEGVQAIAPLFGQLRVLSLNGCTRCGDASCVAVSRGAPRLERLEAELLLRVTDHGVQHVVRNCPALTELCVGGCNRISNISTSLIADHCAARLSRLGVGGLQSLTDLDLEDIGRCKALTHLELCACPKLSDAGLKSIGKLAERQMKAFEKWEQQQASSLPPPAPPTLTHLDLGGLGRLSDEALLKLTVRAKRLRTLDLRGCSRLTDDGLARACAGCTVDGVQCAASLAMPQLGTLVLSGMPTAATDVVAAHILRARPILKLLR